MNKNIYHRVELPVSTDCALQNLSDHLSISNKKKLIEELAAIGSTMYAMLYNGETLEAVNQTLLAMHPDEDKSCIKTNERDGYTNILFTPLGLKLINILLVTDLRSQSLTAIKFGRRNKLYIPIPSNDLLPIIGIFLLTNRILSSIDDMQQIEQVEGVSEYYSLRTSDPASAIGRIIPLYNNAYFNQYFMDLLEIDIPTLATYLLIIYSHVATQKPAKIEIAHSFDSLNLNIDQIKLIEKIMDYLSMVLPIEHGILPLDPIDTIREQLALNKKCRAKPFVKIQERYICIQPHLLCDVFSDFPFYFLFNSFDNDNKKTELSTKFGIIYEEYINRLAMKAMPQILHIEKPQQHDCDLRIHINNTTIISWEIKATKSDDLVKLADRNQLMNKFIKIYNRSKTNKKNNAKGLNKNNKYKGILQLLNYANLYRSSKNFLGNMYTILAFNDCPQSTGVDNEIFIAIKTEPEYKEYSQNLKNLPTIWFLNSTISELFFSAIKQGASIEELLMVLSKAAPSEVGPNLKNFMKQKELHYSTAPLFKQEIEELASRCKTISKSK